jgi:hypothetical protein
MQIQVKQAMTGPTQFFTILLLPEEAEEESEQQTLLPSSVKQADQEVEWVGETEAGASLGA